MKVLTAEQHLYDAVHEMKSNAKVKFAFLSSIPASWLNLLEWMVMILIFDGMTFNSAIQP